MALRFLPNLIIRTPLLSHRDYTIGTLQNIVTKPWFKLAIYLASPEFYEILKKREFNVQSLKSKERLTIIRYYNRMSFRCTPFGFFSAVGTTSWQENATEITVADLEDINLSLIPDQQLTRILSLAIKANKDDHICLNPALYAVQDAYRVIEHVFDARGETRYRLSSVEKDGFLDLIIDFLTQKPVCKLQDLMEFIVQANNCTIEDATDYINVLFDMQIIRKQDNDALLLKTESYLTSKSIPYQLRHLFKELSSLSATKGIEKLTAVSATIENMPEVKGSDFSPALFYGVSTRTASGGVDLSKQHQLKQAFEALSKLSGQTLPSSLQSFKNKFKTRYDLQSIPLLLAMDPDIGIGYGEVESAKHQHSSQPLLAETPEQYPALSDWSALRQLILKKWTTRTFDGNNIQLKQEDLNPFNAPVPECLPSSLSVIFRLTGNGILLESIGGASGMSLLGRFTPFDPGIREMAKNIADEEQKANPDVIFAEINHLCSAHVDNINIRQISYPYVIDLYVTDANDPCRIPLNDLYVCVREEEVILFSRRLKRRVIPRLSSAYNYHKNELGVFKFLCDLQYQNLQTELNIYLPKLFPGLDFYPRITYENTILSRAEWHVSKVDRDTFLPELSEAHLEVAAIAKKLNLPRYVILAHGDQELCFDLTDIDETIFFRDCLSKEKGTVVLKEYFDGDSYVKLGEEQKQMNSQLVAVLISDTMAYKPWQDDVFSGVEVRRSFAPGSEWLYIKIFLSPELADEYLSKIIYPLINKKFRRHVGNWFFIRYNDGGHHIRLRLVLDKSQIGDFLHTLSQSLFNKSGNDNTTNIQLDTYNRELERYGADIIELVESWFTASSEITMTYIRSISKKSITNQQLKYACLITYEIISLFISDDLQQLTFLNSVKNRLLQENKDHKLIQKKFDLEYRNVSMDLKPAMYNPNLFYKDAGLQYNVAKLKKQTMILLSIADSFDLQRKTRLLADLIHMHLNRLFVNNPRHQETMIYYFLQKLLVSRTFISGRK